jgi:hypothetical protein
MGTRGQIRDPFRQGPADFGRIRGNLFPADHDGRPQAFYEAIGDLKRIENPVPGNDFPLVGIQIAKSASVREAEKAHCENTRIDGEPHCESLLLSALRKNQIPQSQKTNR